MCCCLISFAPPSLTSFLLISLCSFYSNTPGMLPMEGLCTCYPLLQKSLFQMSSWLLSHILQVFTWLSLSLWGLPWSFHRMVLQISIPNTHIFLSFFLLYMPSWHFCIACYNFYLITLLLFCYWNVTSKRGVIFIWFIQ